MPNGIDPKDITIGSTVTFTVTGVVKSNPYPSQHQELGKFVNVQTDPNKTYRIAYLNEIVNVEPPLPKQPESGRALVGNEMFELLPDGKSWESTKTYLYSWEEVVAYARANGLRVFELNTGNELSL